MTQKSTANPTDNPPHVAHVRIGDVDFGPWLVRLRIDSRINEAAHADVLLSQEAIKAGPLDYFGLVEISVELDGIEHHRFTGSIERTFNVVEEGHESIRLVCSSLHKLRDKPAPPFVRKNISAPELMWSVARMAGYSDDMLDIGGIEEIKEELIEVAVPLFGVQLDEDFRIGKCLVTDFRGVRWVGSEWPEEKLAQEFQKAPAFIVLSTTTRMLLDAEREAIHTAEIVAGWFAIRLRYGAAVLPNGSLDEFEWSGSVCVPYLGTIMAVRAAESGRRWLKASRINVDRFRANLPTSRLADPQIDVGNSLQIADGEAILAFHRSLTAIDPLASVITLWDAINFYVAGTPTPRLFEKEDIELLLASIPDSLGEDKRRAARQKIQAFNNPPLMARLDAALKRDSVPIHPTELRLLKKLRDIRNPAQHGTVAPVPDEDDLARAWSLVARMLTYRAHRVTRERTES